MITIVTGLPRSGTTLMMRMLQSGGMEPYFDREDSLNATLLETARSTGLPDDWEWLRECEGKCVKILMPCVRKPPEGFEYRFIWMAREVEEQVKSLRKFMRLVKKKEPPFSEQEMRQKSCEFAIGSLNLLDMYEKSRKIIVKFEEILMFPVQVAKIVNSFLDGNLDVGKMVGVVKDRGPECLPGMMEMELYGKSKV